MYHGQEKTLFEKHKIELSDNMRIFARDKNNKIYEQQRKQREFQFIDF